LLNSDDPGGFCVSAPDKSRDSECEENGRGATWGDSGPAGDLCGVGWAGPQEPRLRLSLTENESGNADLARTLDHRAARSAVGKNGQRLLVVDGDAAAVNGDQSILLQPRQGARNDFAD